MKSIIQYILISLFVFTYLNSCGDNSSNNEQINDNNITKLKSTQGSEDQGISQTSSEYNSKLSAISDSITLLEETNKYLKDSLNYYTSLLTEIDIKIDDLTKKKKYVSETDQKAKSKTTENINELESTINSLKISKSKEENNLTMIGKRKEHITKKNEALKSELEFKQTELNDLYTKTDAQNQIEAANKKINEINKEIEKNKNLLIEEDLNENMCISKISNIENQINLKQKQFKTEYEKSKGIKDYVESEAEDLAYQLNNLEIKKTELSSNWKNFKNEIDNNLITILNLEKTKNEILNPKTDKIDSTNLKKDLVKSNDKLTDERLNNTPKLIDENQNIEESSNSFIYWLIIIAIIVVLVLNWLGKKSKENNKDLGDENE